MNEHQGIQNYNKKKWYWKTGVLEIGVHHQEFILLGCNAGYFSRSPVTFTAWLSL
jgi:hypothetical protein